MLFKGTIIGPASGSIAGITASHNQAGQYFRNRSIPVNPNTVSQIAVRAYMSAAVSEWTNTLTGVQREAWTAYAIATPVINRLGDSITLSGMNMYVRSAVARKQALLTAIAAGPTTPNLPALTTPSVTTLSATQLILAFTNTDTWATAVGGALLISQSRSQGAAINFFKGPWRFMAIVAGAVVPPTTPATRPLTFPGVAGQRMYFKLRATTADGRLSGEQIIYGSF